MTDRWAEDRSHVMNSLDRLEKSMEKLVEQISTLRERQARNEAKLLGMAAVISTIVSAALKAAL